MLRGTVLGLMVSLTLALSGSVPAVALEVIEDFEDAEAAQNAPVTDWTVVSNRAGNMRYRNQYRLPAGSAFAGYLQSEWDGGDTTAEKPFTYLNAGYIEYWMNQASPLGVTVGLGDQLLSFVDDSGDGLALYIYSDGSTNEFGAPLMNIMDHNEVLLGNPLVAGDWHWDFNVQFRNIDLTAHTYDLRVYGFHDGIEQPGDEIALDGLSMKGTPTDLTRMYLQVTNDPGPVDNYNIRYDDIMQEIPEPATLVLLGAGGMALIRRRRR